MREILSTGRQRQLAILELLFEYGDWLTVEQIATTINCSIRIVSSDIQVINAEFSPFEISVSIKRGVLLTWPENYSIDYIYTVILKNSPEFRFLELILYDESQRLEDLEVTLFISDSSIKRMVRRLNELLADSQMTITGPPYKIIGNERKIRFFYYYFMLERYQPGLPPSEQKKMETIDQLIKTSSKFLNLSENYPDIKLTRAFFYVWSLRFQNGHRIQKKELPIILMTLKEKLLTEHQLLDAFQSNFGYPLSENFITEFLSRFIGEGFALNLDHLTEILAQDIYARKRMDQLDIFLENLSATLGINLDNRDLIRYELFNLQRIGVAKAFILYDVKKHFAQMAGKEYPLFVSLLKQELTTLKLDEAFTWNEAIFNEFLYTLVINWPKLNLLLEQSFKKISVGIFCDYDLEYSHFLKELITFHFGRTLTVNILQALDEQEAVKESASYDVIVTNISALDFHEANVICMTPIPTPHNWRVLQQTLSNLVAEQSLMKKNLIQY